MSAAKKPIAFPKCIPEPGPHITGRTRELFLAIRDEMADYMVEFWPTDQTYIDVFALLLTEQEKHMRAIAAGNDPDSIHVNAVLERVEAVEMYRKGCGISNEALGPDNGVRDELLSRAASLRQVSLGVPRAH